MLPGGCSVSRFVSRKTCGLRDWNNNKAFPHSNIWYIFFISYTCMFFVTFLSCCKWFEFVCLWTWIGYGGSIRIHVSVTQVLERERWIDILSANICNYNRRCISSFICVRFTRDLEADRWEWSYPFCNQTASICFPYKHPHTPKWYQKVPSEMEPPLQYKLLDCLHCIHSCM